MFSYRQILKKAWGIAWRHKYLWLLGLFASIVAASGSFEYQMLVGNFQSGVLDNSYYYLNLLLAGLQALGLFLIGIFNLFSYDILTIINTLTVLIIALAIISSFVWLSISSQGAIVASTKKIINSRKKALDLSIRDMLTIGHQNFWSLLGLNVLSKFVIILILSIISIPLVVLAAKYSAYLTLIYVLSFIIFIPVVISVSLIIKYAIAFKVLDGEDFLNSIKKACKMFRDNWLISVEMGIILFLISFLSGILLLGVLSITILPYFVFAADYGIGWLIVLLAIIALFLILAVSALLTNFQIASWTDIFLELKKGNGQAKLERVFRKK